MIIRLLTACAVLMTLIVSAGNGQHVSIQNIGSFPQMDGGFENQTPFTSLAGTTSIPSSGSSTTWTIGLTTGGTEQITNNASLARTGAKYATFGNISGAKRFQSLTVGDSAIADSTRYTVQFYYRTSGSTAPTNLTGGVTINGTVSGKVFTAPVAVMTATNGLWQKTTATVTTDSASASPRHGLGFVRFSAAGTVDIDIDDFVVYAVTDPDTVDVTAPGNVTGASVSNPSNTTLDVSWSAPSGGVDGGGYMVVRGLSDPTTLPNANGIYEVGQSVAMGEQIAYIGTDVSFTDINLIHSTTYFYRIYAVDKAFNYSTAATVSGTTNTPVLASEPTIQASGVTFATIGQTSFTINWTNGNGSKRVVILRAGSAVNTDPSDGGTYVANTIFGNGSAIGAGFVVYNGSGSSVSVSGLTKLTAYYAAIYEFNGDPGSENYLTSSPASANQTTPPGEIVSAVTGNWTTSSTWVGGVIPSASDNATIAAGHTVTLSSSQDVYNVTVEGDLKSDLSLPIASTSLRYVRVRGTSVTTNGVFGGSSDAIAVECWNSVTFSGSGVFSPCRVRPGSTISDIVITFDQDGTLTYAGSDGLAGTALYPENSNNDNITITVNAGKVLTFGANSNFYTNNANSNANTNATIIIHGTVDLPSANSHFALKAAAGKTALLNVNGTLNIGGNLTPTSVSGGSLSTLTIGNGGSITVHGNADFTDPNVVLTGAGAFHLASGASIDIGSPDGLTAAAPLGNIQTGIRDFSTGADYRYAGVDAQVTGTGLPSTVRRLTVSSPLGVTLTQDVTVTDTVHLSSGDLELNGKILTLGPVAGLREPAGRTLKGMGGGIITTTRALHVPSEVDDIAGLGISIGSSVDLGSTIISRGHAVQAGGSIKRYFNVVPTTNNGLNATMIFKYNYGELNGTPESTLVLFKSTDVGVSWIKMGGVLDTAANTLQLTGINDFSRWTAADASNPMGSSPRPFVVNPGWNMISLPHIVADARRSTLFPHATSPAYAYANHYITSDTLFHGNGYWVKSATTDTTIVLGSELRALTLNVVPGWNMIGSISVPVPVNSITSEPPGILTGKFFAYKSNYVISDTIKPGSGYWVKVTQGGTLRLSASLEISAGNALAANRICIDPSVDGLPPLPPSEQLSDGQHVLPTDFALEQNYPNPFNPATKFVVAVPVTSPLEVIVYDILGRKVRTLVQGVVPAGFHTIEWDGQSETGTPLNSGIYFVRMSATGQQPFSAVRKTMLMK